jgi:two-component system, response regulator YesN
MAHAIQQQLVLQYDRSFSCFYTFHEVEADRLPQALTRMETAARHAVFCGKQGLVYADELPVPSQSRATTLPLRGSRRFEDLSAAMRLGDPERIANAVTAHFAALPAPYWDLPGLYETIHVLGGLFRERSSQLGLSEQDPFEIGDADSLYHIEDISLRFLQAIREQLKESRDGTIGISSSYLHQLFKRELGRTFLDYLTEYRVKQAKLILAHEEVKMTEVATRVGYRSPQHFSQVFKRLTGILPHQYRTEGKLL